MLKLVTSINMAIFALGESIRVHFHNPVCLVFPKLHTKKSRSRWARFMKRELKWQLKWDMWADRERKEVAADMEYVSSHPH